MLLIDWYTNHPATGKTMCTVGMGKNGNGSVLSDLIPKSLSAATLNRKTNGIAVFGGVGSKDYESLHADTWEFNGVQ